MASKRIWMTYAWADNQEGNFDYLVQKLTNVGLDVRFDREALIPGKRLWEQIGSAIEDPSLDAWAYLVTPASLESQPCREELAYALDRALRAKGEGFPIQGLLHGVHASELPPVIRTRLCVDLRSPDYVDQILAGVEQRAPTLIPKTLDPVVCRVHAPYLGDPQLIAFEFRPRIGELSHWRIAYPKGLQPVQYGSGPGNGGGLSSVRFDFLEGVGLNFEGIPMDFVGCSNPINGSTSAYIVFQGDPTPLALHFGVARHPTDIAQTGTIFRFQVH